MKKSASITEIKQVAPSNRPVPPGHFLREILEEMELSQAEFAHRIGRPVQAINEIVRGRKAITAETALQLGEATDVPAYLWLSLESQYRLALAIQKRKAS